MQQFLPLRTMPIYWLLRMNTFTGSRYWASVPIS